jgi:hypothetical protein
MHRVDAQAAHIERLQQENVRLAEQLAAAQRALVSVPRGPHFDARPSVRRSPLAVGASMFFGAALAMVVAGLVTGLLFRRADEQKRIQEIRTEQERIQRIHDESERSARQL